MPRKDQTQGRGRKKTMMTQQAMATCVPGEKGKRETYDIDLIGLLGELRMSLGDILQNLVPNQHVINQKVLGDIGPLLLVLDESGQEL